MTDDERPPHWERLARYVKQRRLQLGMRNQADVAQAGGPSLRVISRIENARSTRYSDDVIVRTEKALRWEHGSWDAILAGGEPRPTQPVSTLTAIGGGGEGRYPDFVGNDPFYRWIWDYPGKEVPDDEREYAILRVHARRLERKLRQTGEASVGRRKVD